MSKKRKGLMLACSLALVLCLTIGATLAYFTATDSATNKFTAGGSSGSDSEVDIEVDEPKWDDEDKKPGDPTNPNPHDGKDMMPGDVIYKDPTLVNGKGPVYAVMELKITDDKGNIIAPGTTKFNTIMGLIRWDPVYNYNTRASYTWLTGTYSDSTIPASLRKIYSPQQNTNFELAATTTTSLLYAYVGGSGTTAEARHTMAPNANATLFNYVFIPTNWTKTEIDAVGDFNIVVTGKAIQKQNLSWAAALEELKKL